MTERSYGDVTVQRCGSCSGLFLDKADLGALVEAENDWHRNQSADTATLPRITDLSSPPPTTTPRSRAFVEALFKA
jgi:hypothetical protein